MVYEFLGGVRDADGRRGYVAAGADIAAVDLVIGSVAWRRRAVGRPVAATVTRLLTLDRDSGSFVLRLFDAATGADAGQITNFGMPDWARETGTDADAIQVVASPVPDGIHLSWRVRRPYRGGAPPPTTTMARAREAATGSIVIDPETGRITPASDDAETDPTTPASDARAKDTSPATRDLGPYATPAPDIVAMDRVGERLFALKAERRADQSTRIILEARDAENGSTIWETPLAEIEESTPGPLRK